ncbi:MAG: alpha/beta hydrolase [Chthoniobacter sp.]|uniref:alpha/beta hydrolase n=1 Tax=Chthoniobacter sp. TaxID=2510640 RepID=UPI0032A89A35
MKTLPARRLAVLAFAGLLALPSLLRPQGVPPAPTLADVRYGKYDRDVLDVYQVKTARPAPVLIFFHGGGWLGGDKKSFNPDPFPHPDALLQKGIAVVAANYRFATGTPDAAPFPAPMLDSARVVQFVRSKAKEWNIDPHRIALTGSSAGAVICLWIAYHDDMAKPASPDPVERFSTRVTCILPQSGPTTLDSKLILQRIGGDRTVTGALLPFFGVKSLEELNAPDKQKLVADASAITHVTRNAPPTFMQYVFPLGGTPLPENTPINNSIHHPEFGVMLKEKLDAAGVENVLQTAGDGSDPQALEKFLVKHLKPDAVSSAK